MNCQEGVCRSGRHYGLLVIAMVLFQASGVCASLRVKIDSGMIRGKAGVNPAIRVFEGIPFAAPPVGKLRWRAPQPVRPWKGVRKTVAFGPRCMQRRVYSDMVFRDPGPSEDCLYLNVWTPATSASENLPVMVWIYGGGFVAGSTSEARQDGENLARKGVVVVSMNYRLGIFGFFSYPELTKDSPHHASGNYGLMDQIAALRWVRKNIAAFGGDPNNVTIFGESAGAFSVSAVMASPRAQGLFQKAIGESGAFMGSGPRLHGAEPLAKSEQAGEKFAKSIGATSLAQLRAIPASKLLQEAAKTNFWPNIDGYVLPQNVVAIYAEGKQSHVPLLAGWNKDEASFALFSGKRPTPESLVKGIKSRFGPEAGEALKFYPHSTEAEARKSTEDLASEFFTVYDTWKWLNMQNKTGDSPVYRYLFTRTPPEPPGAMSGKVPLVKLGARHSAEIPYVFQDLKWKKAPWEPVDFRISDQMSSYWVNFAKTGNPNGPGLPKWPRYDANDHYQVLVIGTHTLARPAEHRARFEFLDSFITGPQTN
ncbi:MAG: carboxylesterase family protein [Acidobacteriota bacterium]